MTAREVGGFRSGLNPWSTTKYELKAKAAKDALEAAGSLAETIGEIGKKDKKEVVSAPPLLGGIPTPKGSVE